MWRDFRVGTLTEDLFLASAFNDLIFALALLILILPFCDFFVLPQHFQLFTGPNILSLIAAPVVSHFLKMPSSKISMSYEKELCLVPYLLTWSSLTFRSKSLLTYSLASFSTVFHLQKLFPWRW